MGGLHLNGGCEKHQPGHAIGRRLDHQPSLHQGSFVPLRERLVSHGLDQLREQSTKPADGLRLGDRKRPGQDRRSIPRLDIVEGIDQQVGVPLRDAPLGEGIERRPIPIHQGLGARDQRPGRILGDTQRRRDLEPHGPLDHVGLTATVACRVDERLAPHRVHPHRALRRVDGHHHIDLADEIERIGPAFLGEPLPGVTTRVGTLLVRCGFADVCHTQTLEHTSDILPVVHTSRPPPTASPASPRDREPATTPPAQSRPTAAWRRADAPE